MDNDNTLKIVNLCHSLDQIAFDAYTKLGNKCENKKLKAFWQQMADDEESHLEFWAGWQDIARDRPLPQVFDDPEPVIDELREILNQTSELVKSCDTLTKDREALILAYRLEFHLLHPAFEQLFHSLRMLPSDEKHIDMEEEYEAHIERFIEALAAHGHMTPEMELVGLTLKRIWNYNRNLALLASQDSLTGLLNMRSFLRTAQQFAHLAQRQNENLGIMMLDIDNFKQVNDRYGHQQGDRVLQEIAQLIKSNFRASDIVARYGGEEFIVLLFGLDNESLRTVAETIRRLIEKAAPNGIMTTISIGVANGRIGESVSKDLNSLISQADSHMYSAKKKGKNQVVCSE